MTQGLRLFPLFFFDGFLYIFVHYNELIMVVIRSAELRSNLKKMLTTLASVLCCAALFTSCNDNITPPGYKDLGGTWVADVSGKYHENPAATQVYRFTMATDDIDFNYLAPFFDLQGYADKLAANTGGGGGPIE